MRIKYIGPETTHVNPTTLDRYPDARPLKDMNFVLDVSEEEACVFIKEWPGEWKILPDKGK